MSADLEREAREESKSFAKRTFESGIAVDMGQIGASERGFYFGFKAAATLREKELSEVTGERNALIMSVHSKLEEIIAKDDEIATLRARVAELEGMVPKWVPPHGDEIIGLASAGWSPVKHYSRPPLRAVVATLMVPPIPVPETKA